ADMAVALVAREGEMIVPHGDTELRPGDHAFVTLRPRLRWLVDHVFSPGERPVLAQPVGGDLTLAELHADHGLPLPGDRGRTLAQFLAERLDRAPERGDAITVGMLRFTVLDLAADRKSTRL